MVDNVAVTAGVGTTVAADDIGGVMHQRVKLSLGPDGTANDAVAGSGVNGVGVQRMTIATDDVVIGGVTEAAPATDTASSGLNGRLQRIAQRITSVLTGIGAISDAAWSTGDGSVVALLKTIAGGTLDTSAVTVKTTAEYETVAASQTDQIMGATGAVGDTISGILVIPATTSPGAISIEDGATNTTVFAGGASSVSNLVPFFIPLENIATVSGGWGITTGANVSCIVFGNFT